VEYRVHGTADPNAPPSCWRRWQAGSARHSAAAEPRPVCGDLDVATGTGPYPAQQLTRRLAWCSAGGTGSPPTAYTCARRTALLSSCPMKTAPTVQKRNRCPSPTAASQAVSCILLLATSCPGRRPAQNVIKTNVSHACSNTSGHRCAGRFGVKMARTPLTSIRQMEKLPADVPASLLPKTTKDKKGDYIG